MYFASMFFFSSLCDSAASIKELGLDANIPAWVDMLLKCRLLGQNPKGMPPKVTSV